VPLNITCGVPPSVTKPVPLIWICDPTQLFASSGTKSVVGEKVVIVTPKADPARARATAVTTAAPAAVVRTCAHQPTSSLRVAWWERWGSRVGSLTSG
jgi:hypothetical protein